MIRTLYDPEVYNRGIERGKEKKASETARIAIRKGFSDELIGELTGLSKEKISSIRKSLSR